MISVPIVCGKLVNMLVLLTKMNINQEYPMQGYYNTGWLRMTSRLAGLVFAIQKDHSNIAQSICVSPWNDEYKNRWDCHPSSQ